ncbi:MAG: hypothetical protein QOF72_917 [Blastocatellia bacterium]|nr:hypothetical protein [Blastocatellia bacterium]
MGRAGKLAGTRPDRSSKFHRLTPDAEFTPLGIKLSELVFRPRLFLQDEEVLRLFVAEIDRNADKREALGAVAFGFHDEMLSAIATDATLADSVSVSNHRARSLISKVTGRLVSEGQIRGAVKIRTFSYARRPGGRFECRGSTPYRTFAGRRHSRGPIVEAKK